MKGVWFANLPLKADRIGFRRSDTDYAGNALTSVLEDLCPLTQLTHRQRVDAETYARAARAFGNKGLVDMVLLIGLYLTTCSLINAFEVAAPEAVRV